ncbi:MAG: RNA 2',3'-cyclic phosphodiesterase [Hyphomicrobiales bacterium]
MPRLFTGVELPETVTDELALMTGGVPGARWIDRENYHITLRFVGDIDDAQAGDLADILAETTGAQFQLFLSGMGNFGARKPRSIHAVVAASEELSDLHARHERACQMIGLEPEGRKFIPHVTMARLRSGVVADDVKAFLEGHSAYRSAAFTAARFVLYSAKPSTGGGPYLVEKAYDLT